MMVMVCDQGPRLLSFPMSLQRKEYCFPDWKPDMSMTLVPPPQAPKPTLLQRILDVTGVTKAVRRLAAAINK